MEHRNYSGKIDVWGLGCIFAEMLGSPPLCPGKDRVLQLDKIVDVIGTPTDDEIKSLGSGPAQRYLKKKSYRPPTDWKKKFPNAHPDALDLMVKMIQFHPDKRIGVDEAMRHPYLASLYDEQDEDLTVPHFNFDETKEKTVEEVKAAIFEEANRFHLFHPRAPAQLAAAAATAGCAAAHARGDGGAAGCPAGHSVVPPEAGGAVEGTTSPGFLAHHPSSAVRVPDAEGTFGDHTLEKPERDTGAYPVDPA